MILIGLRKETKKDVAAQNPPTSTPHGHTKMNSYSLAKLPSKDWRKTVERQPCPLFRKTLWGICEGCTLPQTTHPGKTHIPL